MTNRVEPYVRLGQALDTTVRSLTPRQCKPSELDLSRHFSNLNPIVPNSPSGIARGYAFVRLPQFLLRQICRSLPYRAVARTGFDIL